MKQIMKYAAFLAIICSMQFAEAGLKGHAARIDLTPPLTMKFALGGYGARMSKPAEGIHDRIWAKALVLKNDDTKLAVVTLDVLGLPPNIKPQVLKSLDDPSWTPQNVMLLSSHTHSSLDMTALNDKNVLNIPQIGIYQPELKEFVVHKIIDVIEAADGGGRPVTVGTESRMISGLNLNRRHEASVDSQLTVTRVDDEDGKPLAVLVNWTGHPTIMDEHDMLLSGGWPGYMQRSLEAWIGDVQVMYYNGSQGDQSVVRPEGGSHFEQAEIYGRNLAVHAYKVFQDIKPDPLQVINNQYVKVGLPECISHDAFKKTGGSEYGINDQAMQIILNVMCPDSVGLGAMRIGDLIISGAPGELAAELGLLIKHKLKSAEAPNPVIGGFANEWISYILSEDQYLTGGYESSVSFYGPSLGETIVQGMLEAALKLVPGTE